MSFILLQNPKVLEWMMQLLLAAIPHPITVESVADFPADPEGVAPQEQVWLITWRDSLNAPRTLTLGSYLRQYDFSFSDGSDMILRSAGEDAWGHPGFGYVVSHSNGNSPLGKANTPTKIQTIVFSGGHHVIHHVELDYDRNKESGGQNIKIPVVIEWLVATGRDHPVWSVTWESGNAANPDGVSFDSYRMDTRGPYGSLNFDGAATRALGDTVGGVAWGDYGLRFTTTSEPLTLNSTWTYNTPNQVNFVRAWTQNKNAEMGIVQTRVADKEMGYPDRVVGRERGTTSGSVYLDQGDCSGFGDGRGYVVPCVAGWPYQLMNYDWDPSGGKPVDETTGTKLLAWRSPYGWLGASSFDLFDYSGSADGTGDRAYATFIVLGPKVRFVGGAWGGDGDVEITIKAVEALAAASIDSVSPGSIATAVPKWLGASASKNISNGYNESYAAYCLNCKANHVGFTFVPAAGQPVKNPVFVVLGYTGAVIPTVNVDGTDITVNLGGSSGAFVSINSAAQELWVTMNATVTASMRIVI